MAEEFAKSSLEKIAAAENRGAGRVASPIAVARRLTFPTFRSNWAFTASSGDITADHHTPVCRVP